MTAPAQRQNMLRKPILMPPSMIEKVDGIAKRNNVSFAKVVRDAVSAFDEHSVEEHERIIHALADTMIETTESLITKIDEIEKQLDSTHAMLEKS